MFAGTSVAAVGGGYLIKDDQGQPVIQSLLSGQPETEVARETEKTEEVAALPVEKEPAETPAAEPAVEEPVLPGFDVLRVERDGSVVVAGRAPANSEVEIIENGEVLASGKSGPSGDFAIVFDTPLAPGAHELVIRATPLLEDGKKGEPVLSAEAGIVTIPEMEDAAGEVLAMVQEPGAASRILQQPEAEPSPEPQPEAKPEPVVEADDTVKAEEVVSEEAEPAPKVEEAEETETAKAPVEEVVKPAAEVAVKAVDVEDSKVFVAGTGEPGRQVRIYINDEYKGTAKVNPFGNFLLELNETLPSGNHDLRVDMLGEGASEVGSRVAVVVEHQAEEVPQAVAEVEKPEPAPAVEEAPAPQTAEVKMQTEITKPAAEEAKPEQPEEQVAAVEEEPKAEPQVIKTGRSVIIRKGDSLWRISRRMLGQGRKYTTIFSANANKIKDPNRIYPGQVFDVPDEEPVQQSENQG